MCLSNISEKKIANEDIVCYKRLIWGFDPKDFHHGDSFTGTINGLECKGHISLRDKEVYFCTDNHYNDGKFCHEKFGHKYSWVLDSKVSFVKIEGKVLNKTLETPYQNFLVKIGKTYTSKIEVDHNCIEEALHSFVSIKDAKRDDDVGVIAECIIPKGSTYYLGDYNGSNDSYASDTLTYVKLIEP